MPNPLFLKVMGVPLWTYNSFTPAQKEQFQQEAKQRLAELHQSDVDSYCELTGEVEAESSEQEPVAQTSLARDTKYSRKKRNVHKQEHKESE